MPPDWWNALRRAEARALAAYERVVKELFGCFRAGGLTIETLRKQAEPADDPNRTASP